MGLVLSGGGSVGVAHVGVLKALEENNIPIDYITGTSMGAIVGGLYASGYSPSEIEQFFLSEEFKHLAEGDLNDKYSYYLREKSMDATMFTLKVATDKKWETSLPTSLKSSDELNYGLMQYFTPSSVMAKNNFDSLFVPFRCVAADIKSKEQVVFREGNLATAVRSSMSYPFYMSPVAYEDKLLFDGGLYNNFPSDVMCGDFSPEVIIGSNVSSNFLPPNEDNLVSQIKAIISDDTEYSINCGKGIIIEPEADDYSTFNFENNKELIAIGYAAGIKAIEQIKKNVTRRVDEETIRLRRLNYQKKMPLLIFDQIKVHGLSNQQNSYVRNSLRLRKNKVEVNAFKREYIKVSSDDKIKSLYPTAEYNDSTGNFTLSLKAKKEKDLFVSFGGVFSSRPINEGFVGLQYNFLNKVAVSLLASSYFGKLHNSVMGGVRIDFPLHLPFYWKTTYTIDGWDYFKSSTSFFEDTKPSFLVINDNYLKTELGFPLAYKGKIKLGASIGNLVNRYYQTEFFTSTDTTDRTSFYNYSPYVQFERNSLDRKQYASKGTYFSLGTRYIKGRERTIPGSTSGTDFNYTTSLDWLQLSLKYNTYFNTHSKVRFGVLLEGVYSNQPFFNNYTASILSSPAFEPIPESKTLFLENFRSHAYLATGARIVNHPFKDFQIRVEGYVFQPYQEILANVKNKTFYGQKWPDFQTIGSLSTVYHTPIGPLALNLNYYDQADQKWSFMFHFGYLIFNTKSLK